MLEVEQVKETTELLAVQVDALIRRVSAKDEEFAKERRVWKARVAKLEKELALAQKQVRSAQRETRDAKGFLSAR